MDCGTDGICSLDGDNEPVCICLEDSFLDNGVCIEGGLLSVKLLNLSKQKGTTQY